MMQKHFVHGLADRFYERLLNEDETFKDELFELMVHITKRANEHLVLDENNLEVIGGASPIHVVIGFQGLQRDVDDEFIEEAKAKIKQLEEEGKITPVDYKEEYEQLVVKYNNQCEMVEALHGWINSLQNYVEYLKEENEENE